MHAIKRAIFEAKEVEAKSSSSTELRGRSGRVCPVGVVGLQIG